MSVVGQLAACAAVPISAAYGPFLPVPNILAPYYVLGAIGLLALFRGAAMPPFIRTAGYAAIGWYAILLAIDVFHGGIFHPNLQYQADFLLNAFVLLAFPFFVTGLRESRVDMRVLEWVAVPCIVVMAAVGLYQLIVLQVARPSGLNTNANPYSLIALTWSLCLLSRALSSRSIRWAHFVAAWIGLIPVFLSGSKNSWLCAFLGYAWLFAVWARQERRWGPVAAGAAVIAPIGWLLAQTEVVRSRLTEMSGEIDGIIESGTSLGWSIGLRLAGDVSGLRAFLASPFTGYGMASAKLAALEHGAAGEPSFAVLYYVHNEYVTQMVAFGICGLLALLTLLGGFFVAASRIADTAMQRYGYVIGGVLVIYLMAEDFSYHPQLQGLIFFVLGLLFMAAGDRAVERSA